MTQPANDSRPRSRRIPPTALAAVLTLAILVGSGVAATATLVGPSPRANRFAPADGQVAAVRWQQGEHSARASVEHARLHGIRVYGAFPSSLITHAAPVPDLPIPDTDWWREVITPSSLSDPTPRLRLRSVTDDGIRLHAQDWGRLGVVFDPAPVELPRSVAIGDGWADHGLIGIGAGTGLQYRRESRAMRPAAADRAEAGCLLVRSRTTVTASSGPLDWREDETWCPGAGVVESEGSFPLPGDSDEAQDKGTAAGDEATSYRLTPDNGPAEAVDPAAVRPAGEQDLDPPARDWTGAALQFDHGDDTFGPVPADLDVDTPLTQRVSADRSGALHAVAGNTTDVVTGYGLQPGKVWLHNWAHPGGSITSVTSLGLLTLVSTDRRVLRAYDPYGRVRWTVPLDDLTAVAPVRAADDRILVTTLRGDLIMLDARTGGTRWSRRIAGPITIPPVATHEAIAIGTRTELVVLDPSDGSRRWQQEATDPIAVAAAGDNVVVMSYGTVTAYAAADGRYRWVRFRDDDLREMITVDDHLLLTSAAALESITATGRRSWRRSGSPITTIAVGSTIVTVGRDRISALTGAGSLVGQWPAPGIVTGDHRLLSADGALFAVGRTDDYAVAGVRIAPPARDRS
ncbi:PQQ-binding-like beta-propeller repeat protein [Microlunatus soli]|uniref:Outer membrane protein assembly factor BamB, contains PQQ-like beta-propeller repeat n=1 Tax=Microlunatus soli TaxID=630515 RepID=A0A1H1WL62_9ACTN|nr:PQQ-binding-like beta-propeller repeat protein [Microlunatus soli]SDS97835.1 Outer membrane protein assembly factor BamB, contains PQQ-like beta-propeller repeat [Microlunatus soli]